jgi:5-(hydroxymethyl)furfural/furfural oxidase
VKYDYIIVGGGSSGCVMAARLSEAGRQVLLIEAGNDTPPGAVPDDILDANPTRAYFNPSYRWPGLQAELIKGTKPVDYEQARVLGGGSSINAQVANRGAPDDYDDWESAGAAGWSWKDVLPYFRSLEADHDFGGDFHGKDGPLPIQRVRHSDWSGFIRALTRAYDKVGLPHRQDFNGEFADGYSAVPLTNQNGRRVSTAIAYLTERVRALPNLRILTDTQVEKILLSGGRAHGVLTSGSEGAAEFSANEIVLCAGAIHTPAILMRSGLGDANRLKALGIDVHAHVPGVGRGLQEHPAISVSTYLRRENRMARNVVGHIQVHARYSSYHEGCPLTDMAISAVAKSAWHPLGWRLGSLQLWVNRTFSHGHVELMSADCSQEPKICFNWLSDKRDLDRLKDGLRFLARLHSTDDLATVAVHPFPSAWNARAKRISKMSPTNYVLTWILSMLMDTSGVLRRLIIDRFITGGVKLQDLMEDDAKLERYVKENVSGNWHPTSTCRMGSMDDPMAVTDCKGRMRSVAGLRIADASVMPFCPRANTNLPTIMVAEKMAAEILAAQ